MEQLLQTLRSAFLSNIVSGLVYVTIVTLFVIALIKCVIPISHNKRLLRRAARAVRKGAKNGTAWQDEDFLGNGSLYPHWQAYLNNLFFADGEYHNPADVEDYINEETAIENPGRIQLAEAMPGLMVSLGFLGTLIGISQGLSNFSMDTSDAVMQAIRQLLPNMQYAFTTSIVGVVASVSLTLLTRIVNGGAVRALDDFHAAMNSMPGVQSVDPMTQIAIYQQEQTALIQQLAGDLKNGLPVRMGKITGEAMQQAVAPLEDALQSFSEDVMREQARGVDLLIQRFMLQMNNSVNGQFDNLKKTIAETCQNQREMSQGVSGMIDGIGRTAKNISSVQQISEQLLSKYDAYLSNMDKAARSVGDTSSQIAAGMERIQLSATQQNSFLQSVGKLQGELLKAMERFQQLTDQFFQAFREDLSGTHKAFAQTNLELRATGEALAASHDALVGGVSKDIDKTFNTFFQNVNQTIEQMNWTIHDVEQVVSKLPDQLAGTSELYQQQAVRLEESLARLSEALGECSERLMAR